MSKIRTIAITSESNPFTVMRMLKGVAAWMRQHPQQGWLWDIIAPEALSIHGSFSWERAMASAGVISVLPNEATARALRSAGKPVVMVYGNLSLEYGPRLDVDDAAIGRLGAEHLLSRGLRQLGYWGFDASVSYRREEAFVKTARDAGAIYHQPPIYPNATRRSYHGMGDPRWIRQWVESLPKPVGIMAFNDSVAMAVMQVCTELGLSVPGDIAVLGIDNLEIPGQSGEYGISSIDPDIPRLGYEAMAWLDRLFASQPAPGEPVIVAPLGVVARASTDVLATRDAEVARAIQLIRAEACDGLTLAKIYGGTQLSPRTIERRFQRALGRTPAQELLRVRLEKATELLADTSMFLSEISSKSGFGSVAHLCNAFKDRFKMTPTEYRQRVKGG